MRGIDRDPTSASLIDVNGRFLVQPFSGVQRFATEITASLLEAGAVGSILTPPGKVGPQSGRIAPEHRRAVGRLRGHAWEQAELPRHARGRTILNLGNTAPLLSRNQVVVIHDCGWASTPDAYSRRFRIAYRTIQGALVRSGARIVTVSRFAREEIVRHLGADRGAVTVIGEGGDHMSRICPEPGAVASFGLTHGRYVLVVGNLSAHKNLASLSTLARALHERGFVLAVAGVRPSALFDGSGEASLPQPARYLGRVTDGALRSLYEAAACFVFPSRYEGFGLPALEAMVCGCNVVASDIPALREVCGQAAIYCDPGSPEDIARTVCHLLDHPDLAAERRSAGQCRAGLLTWNDAARSLAAVAAGATRRGRAGVIVSGATVPKRPAPTAASVYPTLSARNGQS